MRVLLCRARPEAEETARALAVMGHESLLAPVLVTELLPVVLPNRLPDALLLTSARALAALTPDQTHSLATCPVYAVGRRTAEAARRRGFKDVRVGGPDAPGLARLLVLTARPGARLLYLAGRVRKPEMESALRGWGYDLSVLDTYDAAEAPPWDERVRRALDGGCLDACLHYSRRSAELALRFADQAAVAQPFRALRHVCISRDASEPLASFVADRTIVADRPDERSLIRALAAADIRRLG